MILMRFRHILRNTNNKIRSPKVFFVQGINISLCYCRNRGDAQIRFGLQQIPHDALIKITVIRPVVMQKKATCLHIR